MTSNCVLYAPYDYNLLGRHSTLLLLTNKKLSQLLIKFITGEGPVAGGFQVRTPGWGRVEAKGGRPFWNRVGSMCRGVRFGPTTATPSGDEANALPEHPDAMPEHQGACMQRRRKGQPGALKPSAGRGCPSLDKADCVFRSLSLARGGGGLGSTPAAWPPPRHPGPT